MTGRRTDAELPAGKNLEVGGTPVVSVDRNDRAGIEFNVAGSGEISLYLRQFSVLWRVGMNLDALLPLPDRRAFEIPNGLRLDVPEPRQRGFRCLASTDHGVLRLLICHDRKCLRRARGRRPD